MRLLHAGLPDGRLDLLRTRPLASEAEIRDALGGNLCRCTGYQNIVRAVQAAVAQRETPP